jgi:cytosine/adenosine deaminase-related metal-dependent hydrolase
MTRQTLRARWVFPVSGPPIPDGCVTIDGGRILSVGHDPSAPDAGLGDAALLPGFVNAHAHLDLTGMMGLAPPSRDFTGWLRRVIAHRRTRSPDQIRADIRAGLADCLRFGTTLLGDISGDCGSWEELRDAPLRAVVFRELLGLTLGRAQQAFLVAESWLDEHQPSPTCLPGVSPHAPYSVRTSLFTFAAARGVPVMTHLAESLAELELLRDRSGPFVDFLKALNVWDPEGLADSPEHVLRLTNGLTPSLFAHCNYLAPDAPVPANGSIVYCPRTHAAFGHPPHPFRAFLSRGVRVALGTDGLASNPDLDILAEARFIARQHPDLPGEVLLRMLTLAGAEALGLGDVAGSLTPGKSADLVVLPLPSHEESDPHRLIFDSTQSPRAVLFRGEWVYGRQEGL